MGWTGTSLLLICVMGIMYLLDGKLEDQQQATFDKLTTSVTIPAALNNPFWSSFTVTNGGPIALSSHTVYCVPIWFVADGGAGGRSDPSGPIREQWKMTEANVDAGDSTAEQCLALMQTPQPPDCLDMFVEVLNLRG
jgi:hypothetical protein